MRHVKLTQVPVYGILIQFLSCSVFAGLGYWDLFSVSLSPNGYYWNQVNGGAGTLSDPLEAPDCAGSWIVDNSTPLGGIGWFYGGYDWGTGTLETNKSSYYIELKGASSYYLSVTFDSGSSPCNNGILPSWGQVSNIRVLPWIGGAWGPPIFIPVGGPNGWILSPFDPDGGSTVAGGTNSTVGLATNSVGVPEWASQGNSNSMGIWGAGVLLPFAAGYRIEFDTDISTWDSYNMLNSSGGSNVNGGQLNQNNPEIPGDKIKWIQEPDLTYQGIDVKATYPMILADDFECTDSDPITDIHVWGSWLDDILPQNPVPFQGNPGAVTFRLSIHADIPADQSPSGYSMPGSLLWMAEFKPGEFTVEPYFSFDTEEYLYEGWYDPNYPWYTPYGDKMCWKYNFYLPKTQLFYQEGSPGNPVVYWLDVQAFPEGPFPAQFGWKTSMIHWNDDAVWSLGNDPDVGWWQELKYSYIPGWPYGFMEPDSLDMAFMITSSGDPADPDPSADLGDAPDSTNNYFNTPMTVPSGFQANYPTVYAHLNPPQAGIPVGPIHRWPTALAYLGQQVTFELEADWLADQDGINNIDPINDIPDLDFPPADDGIISMPSLPHCKMRSFQYEVTVTNFVAKMYVNVWFDWDRDGDWDDIHTCSSGATANEWAVQNQILFNLAPGLYQFDTPGFVCWHASPQSMDPMWMRITLSEKPWIGGEFQGQTGNGGSGPAAGYDFGETEDYLIIPDTSCDICPDLNCDGIVNLTDLAKLSQKWLGSCP